jgi:hypothetical protein
MFALQDFAFRVQTWSLRQMNGVEPDITEVEDEVYRKVEESQE